jgi:UDP-N-acetylglucosamine 1-carboxyvinyltransferase
VERFVIEGGRRLSGTITPAGNKNAALPLLAAALLTDQEVVLHNIPRIGDVATKSALLRGMGVQFNPRGDHSWSIRAAGVGDAEPEPGLARKIRTGIARSALAFCWPAHCWPAAAMCACRDPAAT